MGAAFFYHMTRTPLARTLPVLLEKSVEAGWKVLVRVPSEERAIWLDDLLWTCDPDRFLPHGRAGGDDDAHQPILIATPDRVFDRAALVSVEGSPVSPDEVEASERCMILFDGASAEAVAQARVTWKALTAAGCAAKYWSQEDGPWKMKAEA